MEKNRILLIDMYGVIIKESNTLATEICTAGNHIDYLPYLETWFFSAIFLL